MPTPPEISAEALYRALRPQLQAFDGYRVGVPDPRRRGQYRDYRTAVEVLDDMYLYVQLDAHGVGGFDDPT